MDASRALDERVAYALENLPKLSGWLIEKCEGPYSRWAAGFCTDVEGLVQEQSEMLEKLVSGVADLCSCQFKGDCCAACGLLGREPLERR